MARSKMLTKMLSPFQNDIERAKAEVARLEKIREDLFIERGRAEQELSECRQELPAAELEEILNPPSEIAEGQYGHATPSAALAANIQTAEAKIARFDRTLKGLTAKLTSAYAAVAEAEAAALDREIERLAEELKAHTAKVNTKLQEASELEGGTGFISNASHVRQVALMAAAGAGGKAIPPDFGPVIVPRSEQMASRLAALQAQAAEIRRGKVRSSGTVSAHSLEELLAELRQPGLVAPTEISVRSWFASTQEAATKKELDWRRLQGSTPFRLVWILVWKDGIIDPRASSVSCQEETVWRHGPLRERSMSEGPAFSH